MPRAGHVRRVRVEVGGGPGRAVRPPRQGAQCEKEKLTLEPGARLLCCRSCKTTSGVHRAEGSKTPTMNGTFCSWVFERV